ncbi:hypothetical protein ElyMa_004372600 [Elysia marginata]|uniref:MAM domain-containing protein n=1 Tax=Elysia marginata TaxID=1093978 RepID=A0AAV4H6R4_9GAST|nr:hypothetical protein ElyMa_004372600 [Elysia marginata]
MGIFFIKNGASVDTHLQSDRESIPPEGFLRLESCKFDKVNCSWYSSDLDPTLSPEAAASGDNTRSPGTLEGNTELHGQTGRSKYRWEEAELTIPNDGYTLQPDDGTPWATKRKAMLSSINHEELPKGLSEMATFQRV